MNSGSAALFVVLFSFQLNHLVYAEEGWEWQNPLPQGNHLTAVDVVGEQMIVCVGDSGTFVKTTDFGLTWSVQTSLAPSRSLRGVSFFNEDVGMIVGDGGTILKTVDGGQTWIELSSPTSENLYDVWFPDANRAIVIGGLGEIFQSTNGGVTWISRPSGTTNSLLGLSFIDLLNGTVVGAAGTILRTTDGGLSWIAQTSGTTSTLNDVSFSDMNTGTAVGGGGLILRTNDGGASWSAQVSGTTSSLFGVSFSDPENGVAVGLPAALLRTRDGGNTWKKILIFPGHYYTPSFLDVFMRGSLDGYCVGGSGIIFTTTDAGNSWVEISEGHKTSAAVLGMAFANANIGIGVGHSGGRTHVPNFFSTDDGGLTWSISFVAGNINSVAFSDSQHFTLVGALGSHGFVGSTLTGEFMYNVDYGDPLNGMAVGHNGTIYRTTDGGVTWQSLLSGTTAHLLGVHMLDNSNTFAVGGTPQKATIIHTTDGGATWQEVPVAVRNILNKVTFVSSSIGVAVGAGGTIVRSNDGGSSWSLQASSTTNNLTDLAFNADGSVGYAVGGVLLRTTDLGITWLNDSSPAGGVSVAATGDSGFTMGGYGSNILHKREISIAPSPLAEFEICYGSTGSADPKNPGALVSIDPMTGIGTLIGSTGISGDQGPSVPTLAIKSSGEMYALSASTSSDLYFINASTGVATFIAHTFLSLPDALAFNENDVLYVVSGDDNLYVLDQLTGVPTLVGPTGFDTKALSYDPTSGIMYGSSATDGMYTVDLKTGQSSLIGVTGLGGPTHALRFDQSGNLFGTKGSASNPYTLISINKLTGEGTTIGPIGFQSVLGLASRVVRVAGGAPVTVQVEIDSVLKLVPAAGDTFPYSLTLTNNTAQTMTVDWWTKVLRPQGNPIDPLTGPESVTLAPFQTVVTDTPMIPVPFNARSGEYSLIAYVGSYPADTLSSDSTDFVKLPAIPCSDISRFQARCLAGGNLQARIILTDSTHSGDPVEFTIDAVPYSTNVSRSGRALLSLGGFNPGSHDVELTEPPGCYPPIVVSCPTGSGELVNDFWDSDLSWEVPTSTILFDNYPNPFNPSTTFRYGLSGPGLVSLKIYNMIGQLVKTVANDYQGEGYHEVVWDGRNDAGTTVASGIYVYRLVAGSFVETRKLVLMK